MNILNFFKRKPIRKTYKFLVRFYPSEQNKNEFGFFNNTDAIFYWKTKGEIVQTIKNSKKYLWCKISSINIEGIW